MLLLHTLDFKKKKKKVEYSADFRFFSCFLPDSFCPPLDPPQGGSQQCEDWGPGGRFKVCRIRCDEGLRFSQAVPQFYTCGAEGFWRPNHAVTEGQDPVRKDVFNILEILFYSLGFLKLSFPLICFFSRLYN